MNIQVELQEMTRRAFLPKCVVQFYWESPALKHLLMAGAMNRALRAQGLHWRGRAVGKDRRRLSAKSFSLAVDFGMVLQ